MGTQTGVFDATGITEATFTGITDDVRFLTVLAFVDFEAGVEGSAGHHFLNFFDDHRA